VMFSARHSAWVSWLHARIAFANKQKGTSDGAHHGLDSSAATEGGRRDLLTDGRPIGSRAALPSAPLIFIIRMVIFMVTHIGDSWKRFARQSYILNLCVERLQGSFKSVVVEVRAY
jgi:hypothetical protein